MHNNWENKFEIIGMNQEIHQKTEAPDRTLCTDCGISRSSDPKRCGRACQFIDPQYETLEKQIHGQSRSLENNDQLFFGIYRKMYRASLRKPLEGAQWTGITTTVATKLLDRKSTRLTPVTSLSRMPSSA